MPYKTVGKLKKLYKKKDSAALMGGQIYPRNISESPEINPYVYGQFFLDMGTKPIQHGKHNPFNEWC